MNKNMKLVSAAAVLQLMGLVHQGEPNLCYGIVCTVSDVVCIDVNDDDWQPKRQLRSVHVQLRIETVSLGRRYGQTYVTTLPKPYLRIGAWENAATAC